MNIYLASRYDRRLELFEYANQLENLGHTIVSSWVDGHHEIITPGIDTDLKIVPDEIIKVWAEEDYNDIKKANLLVFFSEPDNTSSVRGGRHVEFGIALGLEIPIVVIGIKENVFHRLSNISHFNSFNEFYQSLIHKNLK